MKAQWRLFQQTDLDTKVLYDIPEYWLQSTLTKRMKKHHSQDPEFGLPLYQYTAREVVSGLQFIAYAQECSLTYATLFAEIIMGHLKKCRT